MVERIEFKDEDEVGGQSVGPLRIVLSYDYRVRKYEAEGLTRSDAQAAVDAEDATLTRPFDPHREPDPYFTRKQAAWLAEQLGAEFA